MYGVYDGDVCVQWHRHDIERHMSKRFSNIASYGYESGIHTYVLAYDE